MHVFVRQQQPGEMLGILRNPQNGCNKFWIVGVPLENKIKTRELDRKAKDEIHDKRTDFVVEKKWITDILSYFVR
jgi:hypothetical protein